MNKITIQIKTFPHHEMKFTAVVISDKHANYMDNYL